MIKKTLVQYIGIIEAGALGLRGLWASAYWRLEGGRLRPAAYSVVCLSVCRPPGWVAGVGAAPGVITMVVNNN